MGNVSANIHITNSLFRKKDKPPEVKTSTESQGYQYPHQEAWNKSGILSQSYIYNPESFSVLNMLPTGFEISSEVILPPGFAVLTHHTYVSTDEEDVTLLIGVKESKNESIPVPFVIFCKFFSLGGFIVGFYVTFEKDTYLFNNMCETDLYHHSEEIQQSVKSAEKFINDVLPSSLAKKGFANLQSLVYNHVYK